MVSALHLLLLHQLQPLYVSRRCLLVLPHLLRDLLALRLVRPRQLLHLIHRCFRDFLVAVEFEVTFRGLGLATLGEEHFPLADVVHGLVFVRDQVTLHQWTVLHMDSLSIRVLLTSGVFSFAEVDK